MSESFLVRVMREFAGGGHSIFAPSASAMWSACGGSLLANLFEEDDAGYEAAEGTVAHGIAENWLRTDVRPSHLVGTIHIHEERGLRFEIPITNSMLDYIQEYVDWCRFEPGFMMTEIRVWFTDLMPPANADELEENPDAEVVPFAPQGGTADNIIIRDRVLIVTDLKYGTGVQVFAEGNPQALLYAYGAYRAFMDEYEFDRVIIRIAQPRLDHFDVWEVTVDSLLDFAEFIRERAAIAWSLTATRRASLKGCRWCKAAHNCAAMAYVMECSVGADLDLIDVEFGGYEMSQLRDALEEEYKIRRAKFGNLSVEQMAKILPYRKVVENWFARLDLALEREAINGKSVPGHKLVEARANRKHTNDAEAKDLYEFLGLTEKDYMKSELRSPAQMEEVIRDKIGLSRAGAPIVIESVVWKPEGKPTLVPLTDKRPPLDRKYSGAFDDEDDDEV